MCTVNSSLTSALVYFLFKAFSVCGFEESYLPMYCVIDNAEPDGAIVRISLAVVSLQSLVLLHGQGSIFFGKLN